GSGAHQPVPDQGAQRASVDRRRPGGSGGAQPSHGRLLRLAPQEDTGVSWSLRRVTKSPFLSRGRLEHFEVLKTRGDSDEQHSNPDPPRGRTEGRPGELRCALVTAAQRRGAGR